MQTTKTFRLFISSTFNDFRREREVLQTEVFPHIKSYCSQRGYVFQPIDLRWGVTQEAQLDQKTLELCLNEVRSCKSYPYPNFLLMLGDRYGWIPLPYMIESKEFEEIVDLLDDTDRSLLLEWYQEDFNQIPASYILKERSGEYVDFVKWGEVEERLRTILQKTIEKSSLNESQKRKYFLSATEAEIEEGIIPYINPTAYQKRLLQENPELEKVDPEHIFGFFRDVENESQSADKFIGDDYAEAQSLKERVRNELVEKNILHIKTKQVDSEQLDEAYLEVFKEKTIAFLEAKVDMQIAKEKSITPLQEELQAQAYFAQEKRKNFIGQEGLLETISEYIESDDVQPLIVYGESGRGKSALMAQAIKNAESSNSRKVLYRFVGATANSGSSKEILTALFEELGKDIRDEQENAPQTDGITSIDMQNQETFEQFSYRLYDEFMKIEEEIVIFIDAVDQLSNSEQFLWLPNKLPPNVKIVISALDDAKYSDDSQYFQVLKNKSDNIHKIVEFNDPTKLLYALLKDENRTIQKHQEEYFLQQYQKAKSPLYITVAAQELKHWKSFDGVVGNDAGFNGHAQDLANTQQGIIEEFINNLSEFYHHDKRLVQRVLGYIYASRDGLSESEMLQLLSVDTEFVEQVAPNIWHENKSGGLPLVLWARLYTQLKPFLSKKSQDGEELLYFFHREFGDVVSEQDEQIKIHDRLTKQLQSIIVANQNNIFDTQRWGKMYAMVIAEYYIRSKQQHIAFLNLNTFKEKKKFLRRICKHIEEMGQEFYYNSDISNNIAYLETALFISRQESWEDLNFILLNSLAASCQRIHKIDLAIKFQKESLKISKKWDEIDSSFGKYYYLLQLINISTSYAMIDKKKEAYYYIEKSYKIFKNEIKIPFSDSLSALYAKTIILYTYYGQLTSGDKEKLVFEAYEYAKKLYQEDSKKWAEIYGLCLFEIANYDTEKYGFSTIDSLEEAYQIFKKLYINNPKQWYEEYLASLGNLALAYSKRGNTEALIKSSKLEAESLELAQKIYIFNPSMWAEAYIRTLIKHASIYGRNMIFEVKFAKNIIRLLEEIHRVLETLLEDNYQGWIIQYNENLVKLTHAYRNNSDFQKSITFAKKNLYLCRDTYQKKNTSRWLERYMEAFDTAIFSYRRVKDYDNIFSLLNSQYNVLVANADDNQQKINDVIQKIHKYKKEVKDKGAKKLLTNQKSIIIDKDTIMALIGIFGFLAIIYYVFG